MIKPHIEVEGLKELQRDIRAREGQLPKALGEAHKEVGRFVISKLPPGDPHAVGAGTGASVRPSATKRDVLLLVGGAHRVKKAAERDVPSKYIQWGKQEVHPFAVGARPHIIGKVHEHQEAIEQKFLDETTKALSPAFYKAE
jgi:hypothetical protein